MLKETSPFYTEGDRKKFRMPSCEIPIEIYTFLGSLSNLNFSNFHFAEICGSDPHLIFNVETFTPIL